MEDPLITDEDIAEMARYPTLGPAWSASRRIAEKVMAEWQAGAIKPIIDKAVDEIANRLWEDVQASMQVDLEYNIAGHIRGMVDETVQALLTGQPWALERYPLTKLYEGDELRAAIAMHIPAQLQDKRIADLEAENKMLKERLEMWSRRL